MKKQFILKEFKYSIPSGTPVICATKDNYVVAGHLPLMRVFFDFENGKMKLEGDWQYMMAANKHNETNWFTCHSNRVKITADILKPAPVNLNDKETDGMVLPLDGLIDDGESIGGCSGLIIIDNVKGKKGRFSNQWDISFYMYDLQFEFCEIKFRIPVYMHAVKELEN